VSTNETTRNQRIRSMMDDHSRLRINAKSWAQALPWWSQRRPMPRHESRKYWSLEHGLGSRDMETGSLLDVFMFISSLFILCGSRPGWNGVGMGCTTCHWRWSFRVRRIRRKVALCAADRQRDLLHCTSTYAAHLVDYFDSFPCMGGCSQGGLLLQRGMM